MAAKNEVDVLINANFLAQQVIRRALVDNHTTNTASSDRLILELAKLIKAMDRLENESRYIEMHE